MLPISFLSKLPQVQTSRLSSPVFGIRANEKSDPPANLREAWGNPRIRALMECAIVNGDFKHLPQLGQRFLRKLDSLCRSTLPNDELYKALRENFCRMKRTYRLDDAQHKEREERVERRAYQISELLGPAKASLKQYTDIGCGVGDITEAIQAILGLSASNVVGLEVAPEQSNRKSFSLVHYDGKSIPLKSNSQDLITVFAVLHHAKRMSKLLQEAMRVLKPGGHLVVREFNALTQEDRVFNLVMDHLLYKVYTYFPGVPIPGRFYPLKAWEALLKKAGFVVKNVSQTEPDNPYRPFMMLLQKPHAEA